MTLELAISELLKKNKDISKILKALDPEIIREDPQIVKVMIQMLHDSLENWKSFNEHMIMLLQEQKTSFVIESFDNK